MRPKYILYDAAFEYDPQTNMKHKKNNFVLKICKRSINAKTPVKSYPGDLCFDLFSSEEITLESGDQRAVKTGISVEFPEGWGGVIKDRSSMAAKKIYTSAGVIDNGYRGEIKVLLRNDSDSDMQILSGDKIAQLLPVSVISWEIIETEVEELGSSKRGEGGFGSSGR